MATNYFLPGSTADRIYSSSASTSNNLAGLWYNSVTNYNTSMLSDCPLSRIVGQIRISYSGATLVPSDVSQIHSLAHGRWTKFSNSRSAYLDHTGRGRSAQSSKYIGDRRGYGNFQHQGRTGFHGSPTEKYGDYQAILLSPSATEGWQYKRFPRQNAIDEYIRDPQATLKKWESMLQVLVKFDKDGKTMKGDELRVAKDRIAEFNRNFVPTKIIKINGPNGGTLYIDVTKTSAYSINNIAQVHNNGDLRSKNPVIIQQVMNTVNKYASKWSFFNRPGGHPDQVTADVRNLNRDINNIVNKYNYSSRNSRLLVLHTTVAINQILGFIPSSYNSRAISLIEQLNSKDKVRDEKVTLEDKKYDSAAPGGEASDGVESENTQKEIDDKIKSWTEELMSTLGEDDKISTQPSTIFTGNGLSVYEAAMHDASTSNINLSSSILSPTATYGIGGMPASYLATTDPPTWTSGAGNRCGIGLTYLEHYIRYGNFIAFRPCVTRYATDLASTLFEKHDLNNAVKDIFDRTISGTLTTLEPRLTEYWSQVSRLCRQAIFLMGIENDVIDFEVGNIKLNNLQKTRSQKDGVNFATTNQFEFKGINGDAWMTVGMAFSNFIGNKQPNQQTIFSGMDPETLNSMDSTSDCGIVTFYASEFESSNDITNETGTSKMGEAVSNALGDTNQILKKFLESSFGLGQPGSSDNLFNLLTGNYMIPKTYTGTSFSKSYGAKFKFVSAAGDPVSVFLNCIFPIIKLLALTYPESTGGLLFTPWIVNVFSSGHMNIDYGMISSMRVRRNSIAVSDSGLATEFEVTINIDDLKPFTFLEKPKWWTYTSETSGSMGIMLATLVGQNLTTIPYANKRDFRRRLGAMNMQEVVDDMGDDAKQSINRFISRHLRSITNRGYSTADKARAINMIRKELMYGRNQHQNFSK